MLNRRHIRTKVIQSIYSNSVELLDHSTLKTYITKSSTTTLDLLYCMIDFIKEINIHFNNIESKLTGIPPQPQRFAVVIVTVYTYPVAITLCIYI